MVNDKLYEERNDIVEKLGTLTIGSDEYKECLSTLEKLDSIIHKDEDMILQEENSVRKLDIDEMKAKMDYDNAQDTIQCEKKKSKRDILKTVLSIGAMLLCTFLTIFAEDTRVISSKALNHARDFKPKL